MIAALGFSLPNRRSISSLISSSVRFGYIRNVISSQTHLPSRKIIGDSQAARGGPRRRRKSSEAEAKSRNKNRMKNNVHRGWCDSLYSSHWRTPDSLPPCTGHHHNHLHQCLFVIHAPHSCKLRDVQYEIGDRSLISGFGDGCVPCLVTDRRCASWQMSFKWSNCKVYTMLFFWEGYKCPELWAH